ncbi:MAG: hypothetical protein R3Y63_07565 [Eubacteriales bacterium]
MNDDKKFSFSDLNPIKKKMDDMTIKEFESYVNEIKDHMSWLVSGYDSRKSGDAHQGDLRAHLEQLDKKNKENTDKAIVQQLDNITTQSNTVKKEILDKLQELETSQQDCQKLEVKLQDKDKQLEEKDKQLLDKEKQLQEKIAELYQKELEITALRTENETIKKQASGIHATATETAREKDTTIGNLESRLEVAKETSRKHEVRLVEKEQQLAEAEKNSHELSVELRGKERELATTKEEARNNNDAQVEKIALRDHQLQQKQEEIASLEKKNTEVQENLKNTERTLTLTESKLASAKDTIDERETKITSLNSVLESKEAKLETVKKDSAAYASKMEDTYGGVGGLVSPYLEVATRILACDSTKEILEKYLPIDKVDNQILFIRHMGKGDVLAQEIYNTMRRHKGNSKEPMNKAEVEMIKTLNHFYQTNDHIEFDVLSIPESDQNFDKKLVQDLEKPSNSTFLKYSDVYVPAVMKDEKSVSFKAFVKGKS